MSELSPADQADRRPDRRTTLRAAALSGLAVPLAACGSSGSEGSGGQGSSGGSGGSGGTGTTSSGPLAPTSDIPVGGGKIFAGEKVVVTQPEKGTFKGFSATCTHQGCAVSKISGEDIDCTCHGSKFSIKDGSVVQGPASEPLASVEVTVENGQITIA